MDFDPLSRIGADGFIGNDRDLLVRLQVPKHKLTMASFFYHHLDRLGKRGLPSFQERDGFVMLGNFRHVPNRDSVHVRRLIQWIEPLVRTRPQSDGTGIVVDGQVPVAIDTCQAPSSRVALLWCLS